MRISEVKHEHLPTENWGGGARCWQLQAVGQVQVCRKNCVDVHLSQLRIFLAVGDK